MYPTLSKVLGIETSSMVPVEIRRFPCSGGSGGHGGRGGGGGEP